MRAPSRTSNEPILVTLIMVISMKNKPLIAGLMLAGFLLSGCSIQGDTDSYVVPKFTGAGLKTAEKEIAKRTFSKGDLKATDATGQRRQVMIMNDWKICEQSIAPGSKVPQSSVIQFDVVAADEACTNAVTGAKGGRKNLSDYIEAEKYFIGAKDTKYNGKTYEEFQAEQEEYTYYRYFDRDTRIVLETPSQQYKICFIDVVKGREDFAMIAMSKEGCKA